jgi:hypothetical protein
MVGRDLSLVATHTQTQTPTIRIILNSDEFDVKPDNLIKVRLKPHKTFIFDNETGRRLA